MWAIFVTVREIYLVQLEIYSVRNLFLKVYLLIMHSNENKWD